MCSWQPTASAYCTATSNPPMCTSATTAGWCSPTSALPACSMLGEASDCTQMLAGSPLYTAPERLRGGNPEPACDMFSLGATLFAAVEGKPPFSGSSLFSTVIAVVEGEPAPCLYAGPLRAVIEGLLTKNP